MARFFYINKVKLIYMDNENMNEVVKDLSQRIAKDIFGVELSDTNKNNKEEILGEPDCAKEQPSKVDVTVLETLRMQANDYKDKYLRALADYQNLMKRTENEYFKGFKDGQNKLIDEFLPFFDDYERMIDYELDYKGVMFVYNSLKNILDCNNISVINPEDGDNFDPQFHDAVMIVPTMDKDLDNCVKDTLSKGYKHNDIIVRYAKVSVYKYQEQ